MFSFSFFLKANSKCFCLSTLWETPITLNGRVCRTKVSSEFSSSSLVSWEICSIKISSSKEKLSSFDSVCADSTWSLSVVNAKSQITVYFSFSISREHDDNMVRHTGVWTWRTLSSEALNKAFRMNPFWLIFAFLHSIANTGRHGIVHTNVPCSTPMTFTSCTDSLALSLLACPVLSASGKIMNTNFKIMKNESFHWLQHFKLGIFKTTITTSLISMKGKTG